MSPRRVAQILVPRAARETPLLSWHLIIGTHRAAVRDGEVGDSWGREGRSGQAIVR